MLKKIVVVLLSFILITPLPSFAYCYTLHYEGEQQGRLFVPQANIDVGFIYTYLQFYTDMEDMATEFNMWEHDMYIDCEYFADHNTQEFSKLKDVQVGYDAYVDYRYCDDVWLKCVAITHGHNCIYYFADENYNQITQTPCGATYLMYTCEDCWQNILMTWWIEVDFNDDN